jgi:hypothetical protein
MKLVASLILILMLFLMLPLLYADGQSYKADLDRDGRAESISVADNQKSSFKEMIVKIETPGKNEVVTFSVGEYLDKIEFVDLNKDGFKQVVVWSLSGAHYTNFVVYGFKAGKLYKIFENGSPCSVVADFNTEKPTIKVCRENFDQKDWSHATGGSVWQIYVWNGKEFVYNAALSSSPEISEQEEARRYVVKVMGMSK